MASSEAPKDSPLEQLAAAVIGGSEASDIDSVTGSAMPPIELWNPDFCGDLDMEIRADGFLVARGRTY